MRTGLAFTAGVLALLVSGCSDARFSISPQERVDLETRSLNLLLRAAENETDEVACNAIEALVNVAPRDGLSAYRRAIRSASPLVRFAGFAALGELRDLVALPAITAGVNDASPHVQLAAAFAAYRCGREGYARILVNALTENSDENVRANAALLIGRLKDPRAVKWLRAAVRFPSNQKSRKVTLSIYGALALLGNSDAVQELIRYSQGDVESRTAALLLLADLGIPEGREALRYRLLSKTEDYVETRLIAARGLGKLGYRDGYDLAMQMVNYTDPNPNPTTDSPDRTFPTRSAAVHALAEIGDARALPVLRKLAASDDPHLQVAACYAICKVLSR